MSGESILVNFVYCHPVGHAIEAIQYCLGYHRADPSRRIAVALNAATPVEMARWAPFVDEVYPVEVDVFQPRQGLLAGLPQEWDWVVDEPRGWQDIQRQIFPGLAAYYDEGTEYFRTGKGHPQIGVPGGPAYTPGGALRLEPPEPPPALPGGPLIGILPGGSAERSMYPSTQSWQRIMRALADRVPGARFAVFGKLTEDGRTTTTFTRAEFDTLLEGVESTVDCVDLPLAKQLAVVRWCGVLVSPHTGFGMAGLAVGTPWVTLAGNKWPEYYFNPGVPFYSVLPDLGRFPAYNLFGPDPVPVEDDGPRSPSMSAERIEDDLPELADAVDRILAGRWDYRTAMADHVRRIGDCYGGHPEWIYSIDNVHTAFLPRG